VRARIGAARALIDANVPWEHVTARNLRAGLADRYRVIFLPAQLALDPALLELLRGYVERGGRLVLDAPGGWYGYDGRLLPTADGSAFERLFGCRIGDFQYSRANHVQWATAGRNVDGFVLDLQATRARVTASFANGRAAATEHRLGLGTAVVLAEAAALGCWKAGRRDLQDVLVRELLGAHRSPIACEGAIVYRLAAPSADHLFAINDRSAAVTVAIRVSDRSYAGAADAVWGGAVDLDAVAIPANGARWIRAAR
jgi:beta-galactosidase